MWKNSRLPLQVETLFPLTRQSHVPRYPELQTLTTVGSLVSVIPLIITFLALLRSWRAGLTAGSVT